MTVIQKSYNQPNTDTSVVSGVRDQCGVWSEGGVAASTGPDDRLPYPQAGMRQEGALIGAYERLAKCLDKGNALPPSHFWYTVDEGGAVQRKNLSI